MAITKISNCLIDLNFVYSITAANGANSPVKVVSSNWPRPTRVSRKLKLGTGVGKINTIGVCAMTPTLGSIPTIDLYEGLKSPEGASVRMTLIRIFHVVVTPVTASQTGPPLYIAPGDQFGDQWDNLAASANSFFTGNGYGVHVGPGDGFSITSSAGFAVTSTRRRLQVCNGFFGAILCRLDLFVAGEGVDL